MPWNPHYGCPPGEVLAEWMEENSLDVKSMAFRLNSTVPELAALLVGDVALTADMASRLERHTGISTEFWTAMERNYRHWESTRGG